MKLLAVRHGVTSWNAQQRWQGATDIPLADEGFGQALAAAGRLVTMGWRGHRVFCSALSRSLATAATICAELRLDPPKIVPQLGERELGDWEGRSIAEIDLSHPGLVAAWTSGAIAGPPGGETDLTVANRFRQACEVIHTVCAREMSPILVVTHAGVLHAVDKVNGYEYSKYGALSGRWFALKSTSRCVDIALDGSAGRHATCGATSAIGRYATR
ncbi:histidine phosphatase family protein [Actinokineospora sp.]|uniref:histidine phosphatase family protein n=1 Tax=Actinokineospora sp. TaxID=1872133 RepID=UPI004037E4A0